MLRRVAAGRVPVVRVDAAVPAERVPAVGPGTRAAALGRRAAAAHAVPARRPRAPRQATGPGGRRRVPAAPGAQLLRVLHGQRPAQLQPVLLVLPRAGNYESRRHAGRPTQPGPKFGTEPGTRSRAPTDPHAESVPFVPGVVFRLLGRP